jgi:hypothetical protein
VSYFQGRYPASVSYFQGRYPGETESQRSERIAWCLRFAGHSAVLEWLEANPPPKEWRGTRTEFAYTEMFGAPRPQILVASVSYFQGRYPGETESQRSERIAWCSRFAGHSAVLEWLEANPPPKEWRGTRTEFAYTEMSLPPR